MNATDLLLIGIGASQLADSQEEFDEIMRDIVLGEVEDEDDTN